MSERYTVQSFYPHSHGYSAYRVWDEFHGSPGRQHFPTLGGAECAAARLNAEYERMLSDAVEDGRQAARGWL